MHFYDEQRLLLGKTYQAGDKVRLTAPGAAAPRGRSSTCSTPSSSARRTSASSRRTCCCSAPTRPAGATRPTRSTRRSRSRKQHDLKVYIPPGTYQVNRHIIVDDVTIEGAGNWYTIIKGKEVALADAVARRLGAHRRRLLRQGRRGRRQQQRAPVRLRDRGRRARAHRHRPGERHRRRDERLDDRRPLHPAHQGRPVVRRADDERRGHEQHHRRPDRRRAELPHRRHELGRVEQLRPQHRRRRPGDVGGDRPRTPATRSTTTPCRRRRSPTASRSTAAPTTRCRTTSSPTRSARAAASTSGRGSAPSRSPGTLWITDNTTVRAGTYELNWNIGLGAIWFYALDRSIDADIQVTGDHFLDNTYNAIMLVVGLAGEGPVLDHRTCTSRTSGSTARAPRWSAPASAGSASFENVDARNVGAVGINNCGSFNFTPDRLGVLARSTSAATTAAARPVRGSRRGSCRTRSPATTARRSSCPRRRRPGDREPSRRAGCLRRGVRPAGVRRVTTRPGRRRRIDARGVPTRGCPAPRTARA